ncbi:hypothetical protein Angca_008058, partial [Angiostrongylus cantonensis]
ERVINHWPCNPERVLIAHRPAEREIWSFGSGYGGNSLLGKSCLCYLYTRILVQRGACGRGRSGWKRHCGAHVKCAHGSPSLPSLRGRQIGKKCGDDIAWMKFGDDGRLYGINPEAGFFGVAPGTSNKTNPMAVATFQKNSIFTNIGETANGEYFWEGLEDEIKDKNVEMINWLGEKWKIGDPGPCAHPNSRFAAPASQCPIIHPDWESPKGVPIDAIIFGGRRPVGVPLVFETRSWLQGVFTGACLKSETTAAAEYKGKTVMHDPMAMRPFMGYNFGKYLQHWIDLNKDGRKASYLLGLSVVPRIYHVNWFRRDANNKFLWPGYGENIRVIDWIIRRLDGEPDLGVETPIGIVPKKGSINLDGLENINWDELMSVPKDYWTEDAKEIRKFLEEQVGPDLPAEIRAEMDAQEERINKAA